MRLQAAAAGHEFRIGAGAKTGDVLCSGPQIGAHYVSASNFDDESAWLVQSRSRCLLWSRNRPARI